MLLLLLTIIAISTHFLFAGPQLPLSNSTASLEEYLLHLLTESPLVPRNRARRVGLWCPDEGREVLWQQPHGALCPKRRLADDTWRRPISSSSPLVVADRLPRKLLHQVLRQGAE